MPPVEPLGTRRGVTGDSAAGLLSALGGVVVRLFLSMVKITSEGEGHSR